MPKKTVDTALYIETCESQEQQDVAVQHPKPVDNIHKESIPPPKTSPRPSIVHNLLLFATVIALLLSAFFPSNPFPLYVASFIMLALIGTTSSTLKELLNMLILERKEKL